MRTRLALAWHLGGAFVLPAVLATLAGMFLEVSQVAETAPWLLGVSLVVLLPILGLHLLGIVLKARREMALHAREAPLDREERLEILLRHARIVTPRGWALFWGGTFFLLAALAYKFADLSFVGVLAMVLFYGMVGLASILSATLFVRVDEQLSRRKGTVSRGATPAVVQQGEPAEEHFTLHGVPVFPGWHLLIEDELPRRLQTVSRYAVGPGAREGEVVVRGRLRATPRGLFRLGPATIAFGDLFGITRVSVASMARVDLKVLPRFRPLQVMEPPRTRRETPDVRTRPHRFPTEDFFRFRAYVAGDDTRRLHWKLSVRVGELQVRQPEVREVSTRTVVLVLDSFLPPGMFEHSVGVEEVLDRLVETFLAMARALVERGDRVTLVTAARGFDGAIRPEVLPALRGQQLRWQDLGARIAWQGRHDVGELLAAAGTATDGVLVSSRLVPPPGNVSAPQGLTWVYLPPLEGMSHAEAGTPATRSGLAVLFTDPFPAGADENGWLHQFAAYSWRSRVQTARSQLRARAQADGGKVLAGLLARGDRVYRLVPGAQGHTLVGMA